MDSDVADRRRKFNELGDLSSMLPKRGKRTRRPRYVKIKRPEPMYIDGSSPYAEFLPQRFRQYNPEKKIFEKG